MPCLLLPHGLPGWVFHILIFFFFSLCVCVCVFSSAQGLGIHRGLFEPLECISRLGIIRCKDFLLFILFKQRHGRIGWYGHVSKGLGSNCLSAGALSEQSENVGLRTSTTGTLHAFEEVMMITELEWLALGKNVIISTIKR